MAGTKKALKDSNVKVEDIGLLLRKEGIIVRLHFSGGKNSYSISHKALGVKNVDLSENSKEFISRHFKNGSVTIVPKNESKRLRAIEARTRKKLRELSSGTVFENTYLTKISFYEFLDYFEKAKNEYLELRDHLIENFEVMIERFKEIVKSSIEDLDAYDSEAEYERIMMALPTKDIFKNSFKMEMVKTYFPTMSDLNGLDDVIQRELKEQYEELGSELVISSTTNILNDAFSALVSVFNSGTENGIVHGRTIMGLNNSIKRIKEKNIFGNGKIEQIKESMTKLTNSGFDDLIEGTEILLADIHIYSKELDIEKEIDKSNCPLTNNELEFIYSLTI